MTNTDLMLWVSDLFGKLIDDGKVRCGLTQVDMDDMKLELWIAGPMQCKLTINVEPAQPILPEVTP